MDPGIQPQHYKASQPRRPQLEFREQYNFVTVLNTVHKPMQWINMAPFQQLLNTAVKTISVLCDESVFI
jgi:hypothetical protein